MKQNLPKVITIMWFHTFGHMKSIKLTTKTLKRVLYFGIFLLLVGLVSIVFNVFFLLSNQELEMTVADLEKGIKNTKEICAIKENQIFTNTPGETTQVANTEPSVKTKPTGVISESVKVDSITDSLIKISNVQKTIDFGKGQLTLSFHLNHLKSGNRQSISGYVILIGKNDDIAEPVYVTFPSRVKLNATFPSDYRQGDPFFIKNLKVVKGRLPIKKNDIALKEVVIYVFSRIGELLLEKSISIGAE